MMKRDVWKKTFGLLVVGFVLCGAVSAQIEPTFEIGDPIVLFEESNTNEAGIAINTKEPEVLFVTIDTVAIDIDPITGEQAVQAVVGFYYNPITLQRIGDPFIIVGNPKGNLQKLSVTYNPVNNKYFVAVAADGYSTSGKRVPLMAIVNAHSQAAGQPVFKAWSWDAETATDYQDTAVAASSKNGNLLYVSEYTPASESEGVIGLLYDKEGNLLTQENTRLDTLEPTRDEDDPDAYYLENNDVFLFITNIDPSTSLNRITATIIQTTPGADGKLQQGNQQIVSQLRKNFNAGHPSAIENPFTGEFIGVLDYNNGPDGGDIFYFNIGPAPDYVFTESQPQIPFLDSSASNPFNLRHPRLAADLNSGVIIISHNAREGSFQGMVFTLLGPDGKILPGRPDDLYKLIATDSPISNNANWHDVKWDSNSDSFLIIFATEDGFTRVVRLKITSKHLPEDVSDWMIQ
ncbi:MAG: hypothetical protein AB1656_22905 [Candidatus Omnitrophota bacterium]